VTTTSGSGLDAAAALDFDNYNPRTIIVAVNELQGHGAGALSVVEGFLARPDTPRPATGLFWVLRVLVDVPPSPGFPPVAIGTPTVDPPTDHARLPRFPIVLLGDVPLLPLRGYVLAGLSQPVEDHLRYYRMYGTVRSLPLQPPQSIEGMEDEFAAVWDEAYDGHGPAEGRAVVQEQLARMRGSALGAGGSPG
jgi:hypothetical protein